MQSGSLVSANEPLVYNCPPDVLHPALSTYVCMTKSRLIPAFYIEKIFVPIVAFGCFELYY